MTANTARGITYPTGTDPVAPLQTVFSTMATSMDTALGKIVFKPADLTALAALTGMATGDLASVTEGGAIFRYSGAVWEQKTFATFASVAARDSAYAKAGGVYRTQGATAYRTNAGYIERYYGLYNSTSNPGGMSTAQWGQLTPFVRIKGTQTASGAWDTGTNLGFNSFDDPLSTWNSTSRYFTIPMAGTYMVSAQFKQSAASPGSSPSLSIMLNNTAMLMTSPNATGNAFDGGSISGFLRLIPGNLISLRISANIVTQSDTPADNNFLELVQVQF